MYVGLQPYDFLNVRKKQKEIYILKEISAVIISTWDSIEM